MLVRLRPETVHRSKERDTYHTAGVVSEGHAAGVHHPVIRITQTIP